MKHDDYANFPCFEDGANCQEEDFSPGVNNMAVEYVDPSVGWISRFERCTLRKKRGDSKVYVYKAHKTFVT